MNNKTPNLLFLYTDEQRYDTLGCYGNERIHTPNLDRLAENATLFEKAYVTQPVCTPSRSSLLTGLWPHTSGLIGNNISLPDSTPCLPEMLPEGVYTCAHHGKWHLGDEIYAQHGFTDWKATEDTYHMFYSDGRDRENDRSTYHHWLIEHGVEPVNWPSGVPGIGEGVPFVNRFTREQIHSLPEQFSRPTYLAETACEFMRANRDNPWVLYVNWLEPHMPFHSCRDNQYSPDEVTLPANYNADAAQLITRVRNCREKWYENGFEGLPLKTEADWRALTARYWGMCSLVDMSAGRILDTLSELGLDENTIVVFTSDHGDMMASHNMFGKGVQYEESARVPLLVRIPGQTDSRRITDPVSQIDIVPSLLAGMGADIPSSLEGDSLRPVLNGDTNTVGRDVFIEWNSRDPKREQIRSVVTADGWKLNRSTIGDHELYNLADDPLELKNLVSDKSQSARIQDLLAKIKAWQEQTSDHCELD